MQLSRRAFLKVLGACAVASSAIAKVVPAFKPVDKWMFPNGSSIKFYGIEIVNDKYIAANMIYLINLEAHNPSRCAIITGIGEDE